MGKHRGNIILRGRSKDQLEGAVDSYQDGSLVHTPDEERLREPVLFSQVEEAGGACWKPVAAWRSLMKAETKLILLHSGR